MNTQQLIDTARVLVAGDKGLLAMDESTPTCNKRFARLGIPQTVGARRAWRELLVTTPGLAECISGTILSDDTDLRARNLAAQGLQFLGVGVSGGEEGARHGSSIMPGGPKEAYEWVRPVFEAVAAKVNGDPCVTWLGPESAGHFVKMVHNGIEYRMMQLLAETYDLMKRGLGLNDDELHDAFSHGTTVN